MSWTKVLLVALGGASGSVARYVLGFWIRERFGDVFPWATLVINVSGSFLLGVLFGLGQDRVPDAARLALGVGLLGGYTTFSTFEVEVLQLSTRGEVLQAAAYVMASVLVGFLGAWAGWALGSRL